VGQLLVNNHLQINVLAGDFSFEWVSFLSIFLNNPLTTSDK